MPALRALQSEKHPRIYFRWRHGFEPEDATHYRLVTAGGLRLLFAFLLLALLFYAAPAAVCQVEPAEKPQQHVHHHLHMPLGEEQCQPQYIYNDGPLGPTNWPGVCHAGRMQAPIDIKHAEKLHIDKLKIAYQPAELDLINDCNQYRVLVKFPDNYWLKVGKKPYNLAELHFRAPGENAVQGRRPRMSVQFVHFSPEGVFLVIEVPVVAGRENPVFKTLLEHIPAPGKENKATGLQINAADLLPADRSFYRFPGSLTTPPCSEVATWIVMKHPIEFSEPQITEYTKLYRNTARPLQLSNNRPIVENQ